MKISRVFKETFINNEFNDLYYLITDKEIKDMTIQEEELSEIFFISFEKLKQMINEKDESVVIDKMELDILEKHIDEIMSEISKKNDN